jgi:L-alanine-DL-glutamate epimerase-like enolase superfamily enzyme
MRKEQPTVKQLATDVRILDVEVAFSYKTFRATLKFGGPVKGPGARSGADLNITALVETRDGRRAVGRGSMVLGSSWSWPSQVVPSFMITDFMRDLAVRYGGELRKRDDYGHPMEHALETEPLLLELADEMIGQYAPGEAMPRMCALVVGAPFDAALHDAFGNVLGLDAYATLGPAHMSWDLSRYLGTDFKGKYPADYVKPAYDATLPVFHLVGGYDALTPADVGPNDPRDEYPSDLVGWVRRDGVFCHKVKLRGNDLEWDVDRTVAVHRVVKEVLAESGRSGVYLTSDANEMCEDVEYLIEYLRKVRERSPDAYDAILYVEQPTTRHLFERPLDVAHAAKLKPILADEALSGLDAMDEALRQGYTGVALKTCKGQSNSLLMLAKATEAGVPYSVQDLTLTGLGLIQSVGLAARMRPIMGVEANARQFCPGASRRAEKVHPGLFRARDGLLDTSSLRGPGLGYRFDEFDPLVV